MTNVPRMIEYVKHLSIHLNCATPTIRSWGDGINAGSIPASNKRLIGTECTLHAKPMGVTA